MKRAGKIASRLVLGALLGAVAVSCVWEADQEGKVKTTVEDKAVVKLNVTVPTPSNGRTRAAGEELENTLNDITVLVLKNRSGNTFNLESVIPVDEFEQATAGTATFSLPMAADDIPTKLLIAANVNSYTKADLSAVDFIQRYGVYGEDNLRTAMYAYFTDLSGNPPVMSMSGSSEEFRLNSTATREIEVSLVRFVAKAELKLNLQADSKQFEPTEIWISNWNGTMTLFPALANLDPQKPGRVLKPSLPMQVKSSLSVVEANPGATLDVDPGTGLLQAFYVPENGEAKDSAERLAATSLIVGGYYDGDHSKVLYYRLDFNSGEAGHPFGQILRNWRYEFEIQKVTGPGRDSKEEAATSDITPVVVEVTPWEEEAEDVYLGDDGDYVKISDMTPALTARAGSSVTTTIVSTMPVAVDFPQDGRFTFDEVQGQVKEGYYSLVVTITANGTNDTGVPFVGEIDVRIDNGGVMSSLEKKIAFTQNVPTFVPRKIVNIYSAGAGDFGLGSGAGLNGTSSDTLKSMLTNSQNFGTQGRTSIAGFNFTGSSDGSLPGDMSDIDILYLPYGYNPSVEDSARIIEWLEGDFARVMFMACEEGVEAVATNEILRGQLDSALGYSLAWSGVDVAIGNLVGDLTNAVKGISILGSLLDAVLTDINTVKGIFPGALSDTNRQFFVSPTDASSTLNTAFDCSDGVAGIFTSIPSNSGVVPLVYTYRSEGYHLSLLPLLLAANDPVRTNEVMLAVDPTNRIVYLGESDLFSSEASGADGSNIKTLVANLWSWAAKIASQD